MKASKELIAANRRYNEANYDRITVTVSKGDREVIRSFVEENYPGKSVNCFIKDKIREEISSLKWWTSVFALVFKRKGEKWV